VSDGERTKSSMAILGIRRPFRTAPRVRHEIESFGRHYRIDGYGEESVQGINEFNYVPRLPSSLRKVLYIIGGFFPVFRVWVECKYYNKYVELIKAKRYRFLIAHDIEDALMAIETGIPFVFHSNEYLPRQFDGDWLFRFSEMSYRKLALKQIFKNAVLTVVEGDKVARKYSQEYEVPRESIVVMPSMPKYQTFDNALISNNQDILAAPIQLIHHGILAPVRGIDLLIDIIKALGPDYRLTLMGPGPSDYLDALKSMAVSLGNIEVRNLVPYEEIVETIHTYDLGLVIFGSRHYHHKYMTVPNKFWECLQARVPVLVSPESAMADIVRDTGCGIVADSPSLESYVTAIRSLNRDDIVKMKARCEALAWNHSRDSWLDSHRERIETAINASHQHPESISVR
jgi:glycosyltransferase involved in cell wall biosynthesis